MAKEGKIVHMRHLGLLLSSADSTKDKMYLSKLQNILVYIGNCMCHTKSSASCNGRLGEGGFIKIVHMRRLRPPLHRLSNGQQLWLDELVRLSQSVFHLIEVDKKYCNL